MAKRLILMRHAKSDWTKAGLGDHPRALNGRGRASATALGDWLRARGYSPDQALVSSATRTRQTYEHLGCKIPVQFLDSLYLAGPAALLGALRDATGDCVLMIAHNPGIADFAARMLATPPDHPRFDDYPTGATLVADLGVTDWAQAHFAKAITQDFIIPRDLIG